MPPSVAVVVPCRNEAPTITRVLDALLAQTRVPERVVIVDDACTDGTPALVRKWAASHSGLSVLIVPSPGGGAGAAMNAGIAAVDADVIVRLDGHCQPAADYILKCLETLAIPNAGVVGGVWNIEPGATTLMAQGIAMILSHPLGSGGAEYRQRPGTAANRDAHPVDTVPFGTFRRDLWLLVDGFDETLLRNQDYDFNYRVRLTGHDVVLNPAIVSVYKARPTLRTLARQYFEYGFWKIVMLRKFPESLILRQLLPLILAPALAAAITIAVLSRSITPMIVVGAYLVVNLIGAVQTAVRMRDLRFVPSAAAALITLQTAWSAGAWLSLLSRRGARLVREQHPAVRNWKLVEHRQDPGPAKSVAVVIPCRNEAETIGRLLDAIEQQDLPPQEIVVVDDQSTDGTPEIIERWHCARPGFNLTIVPGPGRGPAAAMNAGIRRSRSDIIVRLDGHCRPQPDYVSRSVNTLLRHHAGVVGGVWKIEPGATTKVARAIAAVVSHPIGSGGVGYRNAADRGRALDTVDTVPFGCFHRALWEKLGGYDESLITNEDYDFNHRVRLTGRLVLLNTHIRTIYSAKPTLGALGNQYFRYGFWKTQMLRKSPEALHLRQVPPALVLPWIVATVILALIAPYPGTVLAAIIYPAFVAAAVLQIAAARSDVGLIVPAFAAVVVQHAAWCAGFWHGLLYPPSKSA